METLTERFTSRAGAFLERTGLNPTTFGMKALGDPNPVRQIDCGRSPTSRTADRVVASVAEYGRDSCGVRDPPRRRRYRKPVSRGRRTRRISDDRTTERSGQ